VDLATVLGCIQKHHPTTNNKDHRHGDLDRRLRWWRPPPKPDWLW